MSPLPLQSQCFCKDLSTFYSNHQSVCILTLGLAIVVYALGRAISWILEACGTAKKTADVGAKILKQIKDPSAEPPQAKVTPEMTKASVASSQTTEARNNANVLDIPTNPAVIIQEPNTLEGVPATPDSTTPPQLSTNTTDISTTDAPTPTATRLEGNTNAAASPAGATEKTTSSSPIDVTKVDLKERINDLTRILVEADKESGSEKQSIVLKVISAFHQLPETTQKSFVKQLKKSDLLNFALTMSHDADGRLYYNPKQCTQKELDSEKKWLAYFKSRGLLPKPISLSYSSRLHLLVSRVLFSLDFGKHAVQIQVPVGSRTEKSHDAAKASKTPASSPPPVQANSSTLSPKAQSITKALKLPVVKITLSSNHFSLVPQNAEIPEPAEDISIHQLLVEIAEIEGLSKEDHYYSEYQKLPFNLVEMRSKLKAILDTLDSSENKDAVLIKKMLKHFLISIKNLLPLEKLEAIQTIEWFMCNDRILGDLKRSYMSSLGLGQTLELPNAMQQAVFALRRDVFREVVSGVLGPIFRERHRKGDSRNMIHYTSSYNYYDRIFRVEFGLGGDPKEPPSNYEGSRFFTTQGFNYICDQGHTEKIRQDFNKTYTADYIIKGMLYRLNKNHESRYQNLIGQCREHLQAHHKQILEQEDLSDGFTYNAISKILIDCGEVEPIL